MNDGRPWLNDPCPVCRQPLIELDGIWACEAGEEHECVPGPDGDCVLWFSFVGCGYCGWEEWEANDDPGYTERRRQDWQELTEDA